MNKTQICLFVASMTLSVGPGHATDILPFAFASDAHVAVIQQLQQQGATVESVQRTFLGRAKITVTIDGRTRQIVVSRSTGEVLHERTISSGSNSSSNGEGSVDDDGSDNGNSGGNGNSGNGNSGGNNNSGGNGNGNSGGNGKN